jgi:hypothetical protein
MKTNILLLACLVSLLTSSIEGEGVLGRGLYHNSSSSSPVVDVFDTAAYENAARALLDVDIYVGTSSSKPGVHGPCSSSLLWP